MSPERLRLPLAEVVLCGAGLFASICMAGTPQPEDSFLSFALSGDHVQATVAGGSKPHPVVLDMPLRKALAHATDLFVVGRHGFVRDGHEYLIVAMVRPSIPLGGAGYCGAGTEDKLLLVEWQRPRQTLQLRDTLEVQSCLKTFELASDQGNELRKVLGNVADPTDLKLTWLNHPKYGGAPKSVSVKNGRFHVE